MLIILGGRRRLRSPSQFRRQGAQIRSGSMCLNIMTSHIRFPDMWDGRSGEAVRSALTAWSICLRIVTTFQSGTLCSI